MTADEVAFLHAFEACTIPKDQWTHLAHVRMAWLYLNAHGIDETISRATRVIRRYNASLGNTTGYHETVTQAFVRLIEHRRLCTPDLDWPAFVARHPDLASSSVLGRYYSRSLLASSEAIADFVAPDLRPLPAIGVIRPATPEDAAALQAIYAPYVGDTPVSFEVEPPSVEEMSRRVAAATAWIVFEAGGAVVGYAYASPHRERAAYRWSLDVSVYVRPDHRALGVGRALYTRLIAICADLGYHNAFAGITLPNPASVALHESLGFGLVGVYRDVGHKLGRWHDVAWFQRVLRPPVPDPREPGGGGVLETR